MPEDYESVLQWSVWFQQNYTDAITKIDCSNQEDAHSLYNELRAENEDAFRISVMINDHELFTNRNRDYYTGEDEII